MGVAAPVWAELGSSHRQRRHSTVVSVLGQKYGADTYGGKNKPGALGCQQRLPRESEF